MFSLTEGETKIYWEYSGKPGESGNLRYAQSQHIKKLDAQKTACNAALEGYTEPATLVSERVVFSGYANYDCTQAAQDYLLSVTASGSWKITITPYQP
ncbi:MAG TPA: hypothetical protein VLH85_02680 [Levilinea sp.]|nr:hypothetical protein [Levilinea sp.]